MINSPQSRAHRYIAQPWRVKLMLSQPFGPPTNLTCPTCSERMAMQTFARKLGTAIAVLALVFSGTFHLFAQTGTTGTVSVNVLDPSGAAIPQAVLELRDLGTNEMRKALTPVTGGFTFPNLPFGLYQLTITARGFQREVFESVQVQTARVT